MTMLTSRRAVIRSTLIGGSALCLPAVITRPGWTQTGPIKIGDVEPLTGPAQIFGQAGVAGLQFAVEKVNAAGGVLGREVKHVVGEADSTKPEIGNRRANELLMDEKVDLVTCFSSSVARLFAQLAYRQKKIFMTSGTLPLEMYESEFVPTSFFCGLSTAMQSNIVASYFAGSTVKKIYVLNQDYALGRTAGATFRRRFEAMKKPDQTIVGEDYIPLLSMTDFAPLISKIIASGADAVMTGIYGQDLRLLMQQGSSLGWKVKVGSFYLDDPALAQSIGQSMIGSVSTASYVITIENEMNRTFLKEWRARFPNAETFYKYPVQNTGRTVWAWLWLFDVIKRAGTMDTETLIRTWETSSFEMPVGRVRMRPCDHQMIGPACVAQVLRPEDIPQDIRFFGDMTPYIGVPTIIPESGVTLPQSDSGNSRCRA